MIHDFIAHELFTQNTNEWTKDGYLYNIPVERKLWIYAFFNSVVLQIYIKYIPKIPKCILCIDWGVFLVPIVIVYIERLFSLVGVCVNY